MTTHHIFSVVQKYKNVVSHNKPSEPSLVKLVLLGLDSVEAAEFRAKMWPVNAPL